MRDKLIHDCGRVDIHRLWSVVEEHLPRLQGELETLLRGMP